MKTIATVTNTRSDLIRMKEVFEKLDTNFKHVRVHTGEDHREFTKTREPDHSLSGESPAKLIEMFRDEKIYPDMVLFLGSSDSIVSSLYLRKEGYNIVHVGAGIRSGNRRSSEEINRIVCDHCSDYHFVYHKDHGINLTKEGLPKDNIFVVGNPIALPSKKLCERVRSSPPKFPTWYNRHILLDISAPENFKNKERLNNILTYANDCGRQWGCPIEIIEFKETLLYIKKFDLELAKITTIRPLSHESYVVDLVRSIFLISDSDRAEEEPALFGVPVVVIKDAPEHLQSATHKCSFVLDVNSIYNSSWTESCKFVEGTKPDTDWLGDEKVPQNIVDSLNVIFDCQIFQNSLQNRPSLN